MGKNNETPLFLMEYNVLNTEEDEAFLLFQKKHVYKKNWIKTAGFGVLAIGFLISSILNPDKAINFIFTAMCLGMIFIIWYNTKKIRTSLMEALKILEDDSYVFTMYNNRFEIETIITDEEKSDEEYVPIKPRVVKFSDAEIEIIEKDNMYILILKKDTIYVLPKRCISEKESETLTKLFNEKLSEKYTKM